MTKITKICLWALAFIPLISDNTIFSPNNSNFFMRFFLISAGILFLVQFLSSKFFRNNIIEKVKKIIKHPLTISILAFVVISIISAIFTTDKYTAFWGNTERAEGLVGIIYFFSFFIFSLLIFEKKDWLWFFKLSLFATFILLGKEFAQLISGVGITSFVGNSAFLAGYLLFSIFCAIVVFNEAVPLEITRARSGHLSLMGWKYFSVIIAILSVFGIFIAANRGTIVGLVVGLLSILIYGIFKGENISYKKFNFRKISIILLCCTFIFSAVFISTRKSEIWQKVPGLSRIAAINSENDTTQTRLIISKLSLQTVNPAQNGLKKFLIGWGPENFSIAYGQYYNPKQFDYEKRWFNRAHNEFLDKLVTVGILGLLSILSIYFFLFRFVFKRKEFSLLNMGLLFFGVSFFVYLLFLFHQMTTFIPFFAVLAFVVFLNEDNKKEKTEYKIQTQDIIFTSIFFIILTLFLCFVFFRNDLPAYIQIKQYDSLRRESNLIVMSNNINKVFDPFTTAQAKLRSDLLTFTANNYDSKDEFNLKLYNTAFFRAEEYMKKVPFDVQFLAILAYTYNNQGNNLNNPDHSKLLKTAEKYFKEIIALAPNRQDFNYVLALNWFYQGKYIEALDHFEKIFNADPKYFNRNNSGGAEGVYFELVKHFYKIRDKVNFVKVATRLRENQYSGSEVLDKIILYINKTNIWPIITFD